MNNSIAEEIIKCGRDPVYFINTYVKIQHAYKGLIPFKTYDFQDACINDFITHRFNVVVKSRQLGLSTVTAAYAVWMAMFHPDKNILVIATKLETAINFIKKVKVTLQAVPKWMILAKWEGNKQSVTFEHGSTIKAIPTSEDAGRSEALSLLIVDEAAFIRDFDTIWVGLYPTLSTGGSAIIISTPNGVGGQYHKIYSDAIAGLNNFNATTLPWYVHPEHDEEWFKEETKGLNGNKKKISQEFLCDFASSGDTFLGADDIEWLKSTVSDPIEKLNYDKHLWIWKKPIQNKKYIISADIARGDSGDYSTFHIIDTSTLEICGEYKGKMPPDKLADLLKDMGLKYNKALIVPENNTFGYMVCVRLKDLKYPRLYYQNAKNPETYVPLEDELPGFSTQTKSRIQILTKLEELIRNKQIKTFSKRLIDELSTFIWNGSKAQALKGTNDDLVMSLAIGVWVCDCHYGINTNDTAFTEAMLKSTMVVRSNLQPINVNNKQGIYTSDEIFKGREYNENYHQKRFGTILNDFKWLYK